MSNMISSPQFLNLMFDDHCWIHLTLRCQHCAAKVAFSQIFEESVELLTPRVSTLDAQSVANVPELLCQNSPAMTLKPFNQNSKRQQNNHFCSPKHSRTIFVCFVFRVFEVIWVLATCQQLRGEAVPGSRELVVQSLEHIGYLQLTPVKSWKL